MSEHEINVVGIKPPDKTWTKMKAAFDACMEAEVPVPKDVDKFFEGERPDEKGVVVGLSAFTRGRSRDDHPCLSDFSDYGSAGYEIDLAKVPDGVKVLRVFVSY